MRALRSAEAARSAHAAQEDSARMAIKRLAELEILYDLSPLGLSCLDSDLRFVLINKRLAAMTGLPIRDILRITGAEVNPKNVTRSEQTLRQVSDNRR